MIILFFLKLEKGKQFLTSESFEKGFTEKEVREGHYDYKLGETINKTYEVFKIIKFQILILF